MKLRPAKIVVFLLCLAPLARLLWLVYRNELGANPVEFITHFTGDWTLRFLLITLAITPLRRFTRQYWLIQYRRMLGLFAFFYVCLHLLTWVVIDKFFVNSRDFEETARLQLTNQVGDSFQVQLFVFEKIGHRKVVKAVISIHQIPEEPAAVA